MSAPTAKPPALVVFLENVGHVGALNLPAWVRQSIDFFTEEYAKLQLRVLGAYRIYDQITILEDADATGPKLAEALLASSRQHQVDVLLLVHGHAGKLVGYLGKELVGAETFQPLINAYRAEPELLNLRAVYGLNCHGATLTGTWMELGADVVNGAVGVNWFPEPSLSVFLWMWLRGRPYSEAVTAANRTANRVWSRILRNRRGQTAHPWILSSRQVIAGRRDMDIYNREV